MRTDPYQSARDRVLGHSPGRQQYAGVPPLATMVDRLCEHWRDTTASSRDAGARWYGHVAEVLEFVATTHGADSATTRDVFAATSAGSSPDVNVQSTRAVLRGRPELAACYPDMVDVAVRAVAGDRSWFELDRDGTLTRARKIRTFVLNLAGDTDRVTIDRWAMRSVGSGKDGALGGAYVAVELAHQLAAERVGTDPRTLQASIWTHVRGSSGLAEFERAALSIDTLEAP